MSDVPPSVPAALPSPAQRDLLARIVAVLEADERVSAAWLSGSVARGNADEYSDLDVRLVVDDAAFSEFLEQLPALIDRIGPTVFRRSMRLGSDAVLTSITTDWLRFDLVAQKASDLDARTYHNVRLIFDRSAVRSRLRLATPDATARVDQLVRNVEEFIRVLGLLAVVVGRDEYLVAMDGALLLRRLLIDLLLLDNGIADRGGALRLNPLLSAEQRAMLESLPPLVPTRASAIGCHVALARLFLPRARALLRGYGLPYPDVFERATLDHLERSLGVEVF